MILIFVPATAFVENHKNQAKTLMNNPPLVVLIHTSYWSSRSSWRSLMSSSINSFEAPPFDFAILFNRTCD